ncbi:hypothetical protein JDV02_000266 [Purpureocillium takamizusanense]|uniref:Uncharacterized protein n=1 Tax=Purpureocillium takamizusanense TaxID=2060973 RepID=A0A9Q8Q683_9HYPO|nr:uncharacterized protein JDV02_000266 [Purpureocillium takamizusanense]UNI13527.1 hypothetical protein JDV02_000266 [Purpureocillium takamizusanense]
MSTATTAAAAAEDRRDPNGTTMGTISPATQTQTQTQSQTRGKMYPSVVLTPWDPTNERQLERMYEQRVACTWGYDEVREEWKERMLSGQKVLYWISVADDFPGQDKLLAQHIKQWPKESESLVDTAVVIGRAMREPTREPFHPVGHIAVEWFPERDAQLGLPETTAWVKSLYISWALQATGLGRAAMAALERVVEGPPFGAECVALDTLTSEFQLREEQLACFYDARGVPRPAVVRSNEEWYRRQGYEAVASKDDAYDWVSPATGETIKVPCVFMRKYVGGVA